MLLRAAVSRLGTNVTDAIDAPLTIGQRAVRLLDRELAKDQRDGQTAFRRFFVFRVHVLRR
jgi:hypothetical protein